jgi:putative aminopeptidase FrvX
MKETIDYILAFAQEILAIPSPSGYCRNVIERIRQEAGKFGYQVELTKKGNAVITIPGKTGYILGLSGHVDTLGAMVRSVSADGSIRFTAVGGPIWPTLDGEYCSILTREGKTYPGTFLSVYPAAHVFKESATAERSPEKMYVRIDEIVHSAKDVEALGIGPGNYIFFDPKTVITGSGFIKSRFLDDKISVAILFGFMKHLSENRIIPNQTLKIVVSTYEEVGHGAAFMPAVDEFVAVDMGCIGDDLACTEEMVSVCCKDSSGPYDYGVTSNLIRHAKDNKLAYAADIYPFYGSDVSAALRGGQDLKGGLIGPGVLSMPWESRTRSDYCCPTFKINDFSPKSPCKTARLLL